MISIHSIREKKSVNEKLNHVSMNEHYYQFFQTKKIQMDINLDAHKRYLGIYEAAVFQAKISLSGMIDIETNGPNNGDTRSLFVPIKQLRGVKKIDKIVLNGQPILKEPTQKTLNNMTGFVVDLSTFDHDSTIEYDIELTLAGSEKLKILPLARETQVNMQSNWTSPSFIGDYLPDERTITKEGFNAQWQINRMLSDVQSDDQPIVNGRYSYDHNSHNTYVDNDAFGVKVMIAANVYHVNERSVKYSFLIVLLSFAAFFLAELFFKLRLHPFHYLIIGVSLSVFYLLLLSISEFLHFNMAFVIAASAITTMIAGYCSVVFKQKSRGLMTGVFFALLYGFIFILVKAEQTSLLMGSIAIWLILAMVMYLTRKIDWYAINMNEGDGEKSA